MTRASRLTHAPQMRKRRQRAHAAIGGLLALAAAVPLAWASRPVRVYEVSVRGTDPVAVDPEAMRQALVRATGRRDAATDPALAELVTDAARYVVSSRPAGDGTVQVVLDGPAIESRIVAAGRSVWDAERPFTIVVLSPPPTGAADDAALQSLEGLAEDRGLPVTLVPMAVTDSAGQPLSGDALLTSARRLGGDAVLLGRADPAAADGNWQWTLLTGFSTQSWNGTFEAGINGAADALARVQGSSLPLAEERTVIEVSGVASLADYATVERMLTDLPGARSSGLEEADGATATFDVLIRGGAQAVERALADSSHLKEAGAVGTAGASGAGQAAGAAGAPGTPGATQAAGAPLTYQFHP